MIRNVRVRQVRGKFDNSVLGATEVGLIAWRVKAANHDREQRSSLR